MCDVHHFLKVHLLILFFSVVLWILRLGTTPGQHAGLGFLAYISWEYEKKNVLV